MRNFTNRPLESIKKSADFSKVYKLGTAYSNRYFVVYAHPNDKKSARLGLSIGKKVGNAVVRNKLRRWIKEYFRLIKRELPCADIVVIAKANANELVYTKKYSDIEENMSYLLKQIG